MQFNQPLTFNRFCWIVLSLVLIGCTSEQTANTAATKTTDMSRTLEDANGVPQSIPESPKKVIVLSELDLDATLVLGIQPLGSTAGRGQLGLPAYLAQEAKGVEVIGALNRPSLDRIIELQPDLILAGAMADQQLLNQLQKIAPTFISFNIGENWKSAFKRIAAALNRKEQAEHFLGTYDAHIQQLIQAFSNSNTPTPSKTPTPSNTPTLSIVRWSKQGPMMLLGDSFASLVLKDLKLERPKSQQQAGVGHSPIISMEALNLIDGDWLLVGTLNPSGKASDAFKKAQQSNLFQQLKAAQNQRVFSVDGTLWTSLGGPQAAMSLLKDIERIMLPSSQRSPQVTGP